MEFRPTNVESEVLYQELQLNVGLADGTIDFVAGMNYFQRGLRHPRESLINAIGSSN